MNNHNKKYLNILIWVARILMGITFIFSGLTKAIDPLGLTYKVQDYLIALNIPVFMKLALPIAIFMVVAEFTIGMLLILGIYAKIVTRLGAIFMTFFLPLTFWIALKNPVEDCGCFGDALIISNWATFYKNIVLTISALILVFNSKKIKPLYSKRFCAFAMSFILFFGISFAIINTISLPIIDFRPFHIGADIPLNMQIDPSKADVVENVFIYKKDGYIQEFTEENYPWSDSTWIFVEMQTRVLKKGEQQAINDFQIYRIDGNKSSSTFETGPDITEEILNDEKLVFLMVSYRLDEMKKYNYHKFAEVAEIAFDKGYNFYFVTSSTLQEIEKWHSSNKKSNFMFASADEKLLKTIIRSNPGLIVLKGGTVVNKWDNINIPKFTKTNMERRIKPSYLKKNPYLKLFIAIFLLVAPLIGLYLTDYSHKK